MNPKKDFMWVLMDIIPSISSNFSTKDYNFAHFLLIVDAYFKIPELYGMDKITTEEVMVNIDMFQARFGKVDKFVWWDLEQIQTYADT